MVTNVGIAIRNQPFLMVYINLYNYMTIYTYIYIYLYIYICIYIYMYIYKTTFLVDIYVDYEAIFENYT